jgi:hypothetical protein
MENYTPADDRSSVSSNGLFELLSGYTSFFEGDHVGEHALGDHPEHLVPVYGITRLVCVAADRLILLAAPCAATA